MGGLKKPVRVNPPADNEGGPSSNDETNIVNK